MRTGGEKPASANTLRITALADPPGLAIAGDVDFSSLEEFTAAVTGAIDAHRGDVHLDLGQLAFIEVSGMRVLVDVSRQLAQEHRRLVIKDLAPHLWPVLRVVGWSQDSEKPA